MIALIFALTTPFVEFIDMSDDPTQTTVIINYGKCIFDIPKAKLKDIEFIEKKMEAVCDMEKIYETK